jgi:hypothetical protein
LTATAVGRGFIAYAEALRVAVDSVPIPAPDAAASDYLLHYLPHAIDIAILSAPEVAAGRLIAAEAATPIYLRDNVAHVPQPPKPPPGQAS